ncbi:MAG: hypothetical protein CMP23_10130 [Rickettsiales bacterium]|nr:hypothetical protein [Rickettsiales bacterium]|tara:strand:+ start:923 stop:1501 length:579 start_codon:yes stop_codon:yes gene_type:complete
MPLVLASGSPRRRELLANAGLDFSICSIPIDESPIDNEAPVNMASRLAREKAQAVASQHDKRALILGADTIVILDQLVLGKPTGPEDAVRTLELLSGRRHQVVTAFAITVSPEAVDWSIRSVITRVYFRPLERQQIEAYVATGEPLDKAGSYGIQGLGGKLIERIEGSYSNVVGLPLVEVKECIARMGGQEL